MNMMDKLSKLWNENAAKGANIVETKLKLNKLTCLFIRYLRVDENTRLNFNSLPKWKVSNGFLLLGNIHNFR